MSDSMNWAFFWIAVLGVMAFVFWLMIPADVAADERDKEEKKTEAE